MDIVLTSLFSGAFGGALLSYILKKKSKRFESNHDRKINRYISITTMMELYLHTESAQYSISINAWDVRSCSIEENKRKAFNDLLVNKRLLYFVTDDKKVHSTYENFIVNPCEENFLAVLSAMRKDIWEN